MEADSLIYLYLPTKQQVLTIMKIVTLKEIMKTLSSVLHNSYKNGIAAICEPIV
jgi:hypothetical protein